MTTIFWAITYVIYIYVLFHTLSAICDNWPKVKRMFRRMRTLWRTTDS